MPMTPSLKGFLVSSFVFIGIAVVCLSLCIAQQDSAVDDRAEIVIEANLIGDAISAEIRSIVQECGLKENQVNLIRQVLQGKTKTNTNIEVDLIFFSDQGSSPKTIRRKYSGLSLKVSLFPNINTESNLALVYVHQIGENESKKGSDAVVYCVHSGHWTPRDGAKKDNRKRKLKWTPIIGPPAGKS